MMRRKTGIALFHENYEADRLPAVDAADRARLATFSRCFACGLCDVGEAERIAASRGAYGEAAGEWTAADARGFARLAALPGELHARVGRQCAVSKREQKLETAATKGGPA